MTRTANTLRSLSLAAMLLSPALGTAAKAADIGPESIMLEQIGAVRFVSPQEEARQQQTSDTAGDRSQQRSSH